METAKHFFLISLLWISSFTIFLPFFILISCSKSFRDMLFAYFFDKWVLYYFESHFSPIRKKAFEILHTKLSGRDITKPLKVLEIGVGGGPNLKFYPENSHLTALDMNVHFLHYFKQKQKKYPNIVFERTVASVAENMKDIDDCSMDLVIGTYVLCSVTNNKDALKEIKRVLKPGGMYLFLEHVGFPKSEWGYTIQKLIEPLWNIYCNGCHLLRNTGDVIEKAGFSDVICKAVYPQKVMLYIRAQVYGVAIK